MSYKHVKKKERGRKSSMASMGKTRHRLQAPEKMKPECGGVREWLGGTRLGAGPGLYGGHGEGSRLVPSIRPGPTIMPVPSIRPGPTIMPVPSIRPLQQ